MAGMVLLAVVLLIYFWRKGWIFAGSDAVVAPRENARDQDDDTDN